MRIDVRLGADSFLWVAVLVNPLWVNIGTPQAIASKKTDGVVFIKCVGNNSPQVNITTPWANEQRTNPTILTLYISTSINRHHQHESPLKQQPPTQTHSMQAHTYHAPHYLQTPIIIESHLDWGNPSKKLTSYSYSPLACVAFPTVPWKAKSSNKKHPSWFSTVAIHFASPSKPPPKLHPPWIFKRS